MYCKFGVQKQGLILLNGNLLKMVSELEMALLPHIMGGLAGTNSCFPDRKDFRQLIGRFSGEQES